MTADEGLDLRIETLQAAYRSGVLTPLDLMQKLYPLYQHGDPAVFIKLASWTEIESRCKNLQAVRDAGQDGNLPLYGIPFAVKDNIDVAGFPTTAACKAFRYVPEVSAPCVQALLDAGGIMVGKTNMDQFASGLVGTRTPYGTARNAFDDRFIPGGSSSGSAPLVANKLVTFALGTDTAGSGRIPAGFNGCVGAKSTVGRVSTRGVVPACRSLDVVSCFAAFVPDALKVVKLMAAAGEPSDPQWRAPPLGLDLDTPVQLPAFRFGVPSGHFLDFSGPGGSGAVEVYTELFREAAERLRRLGGQEVEIDFSPFADVARMLYETSFVAERTAGILPFLQAGKVISAESVREDPRLEKVIAEILARGLEFTAPDVYLALDRLNQLRCRARLEMDKVDLLMVPTAAHHYLVEEIEATEKRAAVPTFPYNANLGRYTNFVNLLDLCALSVPSGIARLPPPNPSAPGVEGERAAKLLETGSLTATLPFGVTFIAPAWKDNLLWGVGEEYHNITGLGCGPSGHGVAPYKTIPVD